MGTKSNPGKFDCYAAAGVDEPIFVLLARDPLAPELVAQWALLRARMTGASEKTAEAFKVAEAMQRWKVEHKM